MHKISPDAAVIRGLKRILKLDMLRLRGPCGLRRIPAGGHRSKPAETRRRSRADLGEFLRRLGCGRSAAQCRIVTRFKANTPLPVVEELAAAEGGNILSDRIDFLPARQAKSRRCQFIASWPAS
jgi:hypothetical protein